jgi:hypothetical protein
MKRFVTTTMMVAALTLPGVLQAQACLGVPSGDRQFGVQGGMGFTEGFKSYGGEVNANLNGPLSVGGGYAMVKPDNVDTNGNAFSGRAAWELPVAMISVCPVSGVGYTRFHDEEAGESATVTATVIPIGIGFGKKLMASENMFVTVSAVPQFLHIRNHAESTGTINMELDDNQNEFGAEFGMSFGMRNFYAGGGVSITTIENDDPTFSVGLGFLFGGNGRTRVSRN